MYGFRKLADMSQVGSTSWCFEHAFFNRDNPDLSKVERKVKIKSKNAPMSPSTQQKENVAVPNLQEVLPKISETKDILHRFESKVSNLELENNKLWDEIARIDGLAKSQEEVNNKLLQFIAANITSEPLGAPKAQRQLSWDGTSFPSSKKQLVEIKEENEEWRNLLIEDFYYQPVISQV